MCTQKMRALSYIRAEKITFPPKPDIHTYRQTDISVYRVASLLTTEQEYKSIVCEHWTLYLSKGDNWSQLEQKLAIWTFIVTIFSQEMPKNLR